MATGHVSDGNNPRSGWRVVNREGGQSVGYLQAPDYCENRCHHKSYSPAWILLNRPSKCYSVLYESYMYSIDPSKSYSSPYESYSIDPSKSYSSPYESYSIVRPPERCRTSTTIARLRKRRRLLLLQIRPIRGQALSDAKSYSPVMFMYVSLLESPHGRVDDPITIPV